MTHKSNKNRKKTLQPPPSLAVQQEGSTLLHIARIRSANTRNGHQRNKSRNFVEQTELFVVAPGFFFCTINFIFTIFLSLFLPPSLSLPILCYNPLFFPQLFLHLLSASSLLVSSSSSLSSPTCHHITPPSYTFTTCWLAFCNNHTHPQPSAIHDTSTLYYNSGNIPKHTQGPQNLAAPRQPPPPTYPTSFLPLLLAPLLTITQVYVSSQATIITPNTTVYRYYHQNYKITGPALILWICYC
jgi:hypothetical protein